MNSVLGDKIRVGMTGPAVHWLYDILHDMLLM